VIAVAFYSKNGMIKEGVLAKWKMVFRLLRRVNQMGKVQ
jgi:hypothetical protein